MPQAKPIRPRPLESLPRQELRRFSGGQIARDMDETVEQSSHQYFIEGDVNSIDVIVECGERRISY